MAANTSLVTKITGQAWVRDTDGTLKPLQEGMHIPADANIVTGNGASVQLQAVEQPTLTVGENRDVQISADVAQSDVDAQDSAAALVETDTARIIAALEAGQDPLDELDPTAAVLQGGTDGAGGSSFTRLLSVVELTTPLALEYPRPTWPVTEEIRLGGARSNRAPELTGDAAQLLDQLNDDSDVIAGLNVGQYFSDPDGHSLTFSATGLPPGLTINPNTGVISGQLDSSASQGGPGSNGIYNVVVTASDPYGASVSLPFTWTTLNPPPVAADDTATTEENTIVTGNVLTGDADGNGQDIDPDGDTLTVIEITNTDGGKVPAGTPISGANANGEKGGGSFTIRPDGSFSFDPGTDFDYLAVGESTTTVVTYEISDGDGGFDTATLTITVTGTNDAPAIHVDGTDDAATVVEIEDGADGENTATHTKEGTITFSDADDSDTHDITLKSVPDDYLGDFIFTVNGDKTIDWTFSVPDQDIDHLAKDQELVQEYVIVVDDGNGGTAEQTVTITIIGTNDAPIITSKDAEHAGTVVEDNAENTTSGQLTYRDDDNDTHDSQTWALVNGESLTTVIDGIYGHIKLEADGTWTYHLDNTRAETNALKTGEEVTETFKARVTDQPGAYAEQDIVITIVGNTNGVPAIVPEDHNGGGLVNGHITVHEEGLVADDKDNHIANGEIKVSADDGLASIMVGDQEFTLDQLVQLSADNPSGVIDVGHGQIVLTGFNTDASVGGVATEGTLSYTYELGENQEHGIPESDTDKEIYLSVDLSVTSVDSPNRQGETKEGQLIIKVIDDTPAISLTDIDLSNAESLLTQDKNTKGTESDSRSVSFAALFTVAAKDAGADGQQGDIDWAYTLGFAQDGKSGLYSGGQAIELSLDDDGNVLGTAGGEPVFTVSVDVGGTVTLTQYAPIDHDDKDDHNEIVGLVADRITLTGAATITDGDGDKATASKTAQIGHLITFQDDGPSIGKPDSVEVDEQYLKSGSSDTDSSKTTVTGALNVDFGADASSARDTQFTDDIVSKLDALGLAAGKTPLVYTLSDNNHVLTATAGGKPIFTVTITDPSGTPGYEFKLQGAIDHASDGGNTVSDQLLDMPFRVIDADGDTVPGSFQVTIKDDAGHGDTHELRLDEDTAITFNTSADGANNNVVIGAGAETDKPQFGEAIVGDDGSITYTPNENFSGEDRFTYTTTENGIKTTTVVTVIVNPVADKPSFGREQDGPGNVIPVATNEDESVALGLKAPEVTDTHDWSGDLDNFDNPERLGEITLGGFLKGAILLVDGEPASIQPDDQGVVRIKLIGEGAPEHISTIDDANLLELTVEQFESLQVLPAPESNENFTITAEVTSYEVDNTGKPLVDSSTNELLDGATTITEVDVVVRAVTDPIKLEFKGGDELAKNGTLNAQEDEPFNLKEFLEVSYPEDYEVAPGEDSRPGDGNSGPDIDGSEERWFEISGLPEGTTIKGGTVIGTAEDGTITIKVAAPGLSQSATDLPDMFMTAPKDFSGTLSGIEVTLVAVDRDVDGSGENGQREESSIDLTLHISPVAGDADAPDVQTKEDTAIAFMAGLKVTDDNTDVSGGAEGERITAIIVKGIPEGWVLSDARDPANVIEINLGDPKTDGTYEFVVPESAVSNQEWGGYILTPPAHSSLDATVTLEVTTVDTNIVNGHIESSEVTQDLPVEITVTPVAEEITYDPDNPDNPDNPSWGKEGDDLTMTKGHDYQSEAPGVEDAWFALNNDDFDLSDRWYNVDGIPAAGESNDASADGGTEKTYAVLTPVLVNGSYEHDSADGALFRYKTGEGEDSYQYAEYRADLNGGEGGFLVPMEYLDSVEFRAPEHVSGTFNIKVQAKTVDTDADGNDVDTAVSGEAWLKGIVINPDADPVTLGVQPAQGNEDTAIELHINPTSADPSEEFEVTISQIPVGATLKYGDQTYTVDADGTVRNAADEDVGSNHTLVIKDFKASEDLSITPPLNSNDDFQLNVEARTVDTFDGITDYSEPQSQSIDVKVKGVADPATIVFKDVTFTEAHLDGNGVPGAGKSIALSELIESVTMDDKDGSETLSFKLTGFPDGFEISGEGVIFMGGTGEGREWVIQVGNGKELSADGSSLLADVLSEITITAPEHFSGALPGTITAITTENDGHSLTGEAQKWNVDVTPTPESVLAATSTIDEDTLGKVDFSIDNKGDTNEVLTMLSIKAGDVDGDKGFTLYMGNGEHAITLQAVSEQADSGVTLEGGYYVLTDASVINNIYAQADANFAHNTNGAAQLSFGVKYEVTDYAEDDSGLITKKITDESTHEIKVTPVTDPVDLTVSSPASALEQRGTFTVDFTVSKQPDDQAAGEDPVSDYDGSERFTQIIVDGVPDGMLLTGVALDGSATSVGNVAFLGNGQWLISIPDSDAARFTGDINAQLHFEAGALLGNGTHALGITVVTQDTGAENVEVATQQPVTIETAFTGSGGGEAPATVEVTFSKGDFSGTEDVAFTLDQAFDATVSQPDANFTLVLKLPKDAIVTQDGETLAFTRIGDADADDAVWVITGGGDVNEFLNGIEIMPPEHLNDNKGGLDIDATLTAYLDNGSQSQDSVQDTISLTPDTDGAVIDITFSAADADGNPTNDKAQDGRDVAITLSVRDDVDVGSEFGDSVYITMTESDGLNGGTLYDSNGEPLVKLTDAERAEYELPEGDYYVARLPEGQTAVDVRYVPSDGQVYQAGQITIDARVRSKEQNAENWEIAGSSAEGNREAVNNGYDLTVGTKVEGTDQWVVTGTEADKADSGSAIVLNIGGTGLLDTDGSEQVLAAQLTGVPAGFLVYVDGKLASNAGGADGTNDWLIPVQASGEGAVLPQISILPPQHWSGTLNGLKLSVLSGEKGQETWGDGAVFDLVVQPVADGILSFTPAPAFNAQDGIVHLNLNIALVDRQDASVDNADDENVETVSLNLSGLGKHAMFLVDGKVYEHVTYNDDGSYTITGLSQKQVNELAFVQTADQVQKKLDVKAWTVDGDDTSEEKSATVDLSIVERQPVSATDGDDIIVGTQGSETLIGGEGDDIIFGGAGNDTLIGGKGDDILIGGAGDDIFKWQAGDQGTVAAPATDTIMDFGVNAADPNGNDVLNLADLLQGEHYSIDDEGNLLGNLDQYLFFEQNGSDTIVSVSSQGGTDGNFDADKVDQKIVLKDVSIDSLTDAGTSQSDIINNLIAQGKLVVDQGS